MKQEKGEEGRSWYGGVALLLLGKPPRRWLPLLGDSRAAGGRKRTKQPLLLGAVREESKLLLRWLLTGGGRTCVWWPAGGVVCRQLLFSIVGREGEGV